MDRMTWRPLIQPKEMVMNCRLGILAASVTLFSLQPVLLGQNSTSRLIAQQQQPASVEALTIAGRVHLKDGSEATHARAYFSWLGNDFQVHFLPITVDAHGRFSSTLKLSPPSSQRLGAISVFSFGEP